MNLYEYLDFVRESLSKLTTQLPNLLNVFNSALPLVVALLTFFAIYIYYNKRKFTLFYRLENPSDLDASPKSINNIIENGYSIFYLFKYLYSSSFLMWILWFFISLFMFFTFGDIGVKVTIAIIASIQIVLLSKLYSLLYKIQIEEGQKNYGYISLYTIFISVTRLFVYLFSLLKAKSKPLRFPKVSSFLDKLSVKGKLRMIFYAVFLLFWVITFPITLLSILIPIFVFILICALIPIFLILTSLKAFILYEAFLLFYYFIKCMPLHQAVNVMSKEPSFVNIEMRNEETMCNLLLHQTTNSDYRFKSYITHKEFIVPHFNVKKICEDNEFELRQLDNITNKKFLLIPDLVNLESYQDATKMFLNIFVNTVMYRVWYKKTQIYLKMNDLENTKLALETAIETAKSTTIFPRKNKRIYSQFISFLKTSTELNEIRNDAWFVKLLSNA